MSSAAETPSSASRTSKPKASAPKDEELKMLANPGRAKACTSCRQVKLKCDSAETFPASCTRCSTKGLDCRMDANFKRIPTRHKLQEVTTELSVLKEVIKSQRESTAQHQTGEASQASLSPDNFLQRPQSWSTRSSSMSDHRPSNFFGITNFESSVFEIGDQHLGALQLNGMTILHLFNHFYQHYYAHGVVLDTTLSLAQLLHQSPLLFWTIIITSCRTHPDYSALHAELRQPYEQLLASYFLKPMHSTQTLQALLILTTWPLPVKAQPDDVTWYYCGLMTNAVRHAGMHEPGKQKEYGFPRATSREIELRTQLWLQVFHRDITYSSRFGLPPLLADEPTLRNVAQIMNDHSLPDDFVAQLSIARKLAKAMHALSLQENVGTRNSFILACSGELDILRKTGGNKWTPMTELQFLGAKLIIYGWSMPGYRSDPSVIPSTSAPEPSLSAKLILYEALEVAAACIRCFGELNPSNRSSSTASLSALPPQVFYPKVYLFTTYFAALMLYHFLSTIPSAPLPSQDLARNHIRLAHRIISRCAIANSAPEFARLAQNIELIGEFVNTGRQLPPEATVKSRWGAALFYDAMFKLAAIKQEKGGRSYAHDLTQGPLPEDDPVMGARQMPVYQPKASDSSCHDGYGSGEVSYRYAGLQTEQNQYQQQQFMPQDWNENTFWGWDLNMMDTTDMEIDWAGLEGWQP